MHDPVSVCMHSGRKLSQLLFSFVVYFMQSTAERLTTHPLFSTMNEEQQEETMDGIEKHLMTSIYNKYVVHVLSL